MLVRWVGNFRWVSNGEGAFSGKGAICHAPFSFNHTPNIFKDLSPAPSTQEAWRLRFSTSCSNGNTKKAITLSGPRCSGQMQSGSQILLAKLTGTCSTNGDYRFQHQNKAPWNLALGNGPLSKQAGSSGFLWKWEEWSILSWWVIDAYISSMHGCSSLLFGQRRNEEPSAGIGGMASANIEILSPGTPTRTSVWIVVMRRI